MCACVYDDVCVRVCWAVCDAVLTPKQMPVLNVLAFSLLFNDANSKSCFFKHFCGKGSIDFSCDVKFTNGINFHIWPYNKTGGSVLCLICIDFK